MIHSGQSEMFHKTDNNTDSETTGLQNQFAISDRFASKNETPALFYLLKVVFTLLS